MPELPEVEYTRERLSRWLRGGRVVSCEVQDARLVRPARPRAVAEALVERKVTGVERRGKWLRLVFDRELSVFVHLAMTGWFELAPTDEALRHERARITVLRGKAKTRVAYVDARRWGRWVESRADIPPWAKLGPDALDAEIDVKVLHARLARRKKQSIKEALLDQALIAGVGNIQAAEALWKAKVDPRSPAASITPRALAGVVKAIGWTVARTLKDLARSDGGEADPWIVYGHKGRPCPRCGAIFVRIELGGRTTTFCPGCQT
jgi:formamidopyrimidine-DNA glycosylase